MIERLRRGPATVRHSPAAAPGARRRPFGHRLGRGEGGWGLVEFALVIPIFLAIVFGLTDLGRGVYYYNTLANAAREGARYAVVLQESDYTVAGNQSGTYTASSYVGTNTIVGRAARLTEALDPAQVTVQVALPGYFPELPATVTVSYPFRPIVTGFVGNFSLTLQASSTMLVSAPS